MSTAPAEAKDVRKRLVVCCDGTWNSADSGASDTNVALMARSIHATTGTGSVLQTVLYLRGVGTTGLEITKIFDGATSKGIDDTIKSAYMFIAQNYVPGDEIYLFGFSRGAFTARSIVGLISAVGLLKRWSLKYVGKAWKYFREHDRPHSPAHFVAEYPGAEVHEDVRIAFLGVWDTVGALGIPGHLFEKVNARLYGFYDTSLCPIVKRAYHALAIDEHRDSFVPTLWTGAIPETCEEVEQVWFAGAHADVGGGYDTRKLADIPLRWMADKARAAGLVLDQDMLPRSADLDALAPRHDSSAGLFAFNRIMPTVRAVCGQVFEVPFNQKLYLPTDENRRRLPVINELVHRSVLDRWGKTCGVFDHDEGDQHSKAYRPANVAALLAEAGSLKAEVRVTDLA